MLPLFAIIVGLCMAGTRAHRHEQPRYCLIAARIFPVIDVMDRKALLARLPDVTAARELTGIPKESPDLFPELLIELLTVLRVGIIDNIAVPETADMSLTHLKAGIL